MSLERASTIEALQLELKRRMDELQAAMIGRPATKQDIIHAIPPRASPDHTGLQVVSPSAVRLAADDFSTLLKEIKRVLGR